MIARLACAGLIALAAACASRNPDPAAASRISADLQRLGASEARGNCFARRIAGSLSADKAEQAAAIAQMAKSRDDMRDGVLAADFEIRRAFIGANFACGR